MVIESFKENASKVNSIHPSRMYEFSLNFFVEAVKMLEMAIKRLETVPDLREYLSRRKEEAKAFVM